MNQPTLTDNSTIPEIYSYLKAIPAKYWIEDNYGSGNEKCHCVAGHINQATSSDTACDSGLTYKLRQASKQFMDNYTHDLVSVNDGYVTAYWQPTPKNGYWLCSVT